MAKKQVQLEVMTTLKRYNLVVPQIQLTTWKKSTCLTAKCNLQLGQWQLAQTQNASYNLQSDNFRNGKMQHTTLIKTTCAKCSTFWTQLRVKYFFFWRNFEKGWSQVSCTQITTFEMADDNLTRAKRNLQLAEGQLWESVTFMWHQSHQRRSAWHQSHQRRPAWYNICDWTFIENHLYFEQSVCLDKLFYCHAEVERIVINNIIPKRVPKSSRFPIW